MTDNAWRKHYPAVQLWLEEEIWGHRIYDESTPDLLTLELFNVLRSLRKRGIPPLGGASNGDLQVSFPRSLILRTILFNNPNLREPLTQGLDNSRCWQVQFESLYHTWREYTGRSGNTPEVVSRYGIERPESFSYLQQRFSDYETYVNLVELMRRTAVEFESNKRWTSKFLFPYCEPALFEDINERTFSTDRRFFGRSGELAYLMLDRSGLGSEIWQHLCTVVFDPASQAKRWEKVIRPLMHQQDLAGLAETGENGDGELRIGYLPYQKHQTFRTLGEDLRTLLSCRMPEYDVIPHLSSLVAFHLLHYVLVISNEGLGNGSDDALHYVLEIQSNRPDVVRRLARRQYQLNNELSLRRLRARLRQIRGSGEVGRHVARNALQELMGWLKAHHWRVVNSNPEAGRARTVEALWEAFENAAIKKHKQHLAKVHHAYARTCGLASREGTRSYRYAPTDAFLRTIVLSNVEHRMEYELFLDRLYDRYGFIVAKRHADNLGLRVDLSDFDANDRRLRMRLGGLGLLQVLSDDLAFVINRYREEPAS